MAAPKATADIHPDLKEEAAPFTQKQLLSFHAMEKEFGEQLKTVSPSVVIRFVRGYENEPDPIAASVEKFREFLKWRKELKVDQILETKFDKETDFRKFWPGGLHGVTKQGRPIYVERVGKIDPVNLMGTFNIEQLINFHTQTMERLQKVKDDISARNGRTMYKHLVILDLDGLGYAHMGNQFYEPMKRFVNIDQYYYPETLHKMVIVNAPWIFKMAWKIVKPWIHPITRERIKMGHEHLLELIDEDQLPRFLGGKCQCVGGKCLEVPFDDGRAHPLPAAAAKEVEQVAEQLAKAQIEKEVNFDPASVSESTDDLNKDQNKS